MRMETISTFRNLHKETIVFFCSSLPPFSVRGIARLKLFHLEPEVEITPVRLRSAPLSYITNYRVLHGAVRQEDRVSTNRT